ncbi:MAG: pyridoxamine 5'-phosphate oxidase family protein [Nitriliruptor sp.]
MDGAAGSPEPPEWHERSTLPAELIEVLRRPPGGFVAVIATVDVDGSPRTATFGVLRAPSPTVLRFGCRRTHTTFANIERDGRVMVALHAAPGLAVGIRGRAHVAASEIAAMPTNALIEVAVEAVKNDAVPQLPITDGAAYAASAEMAAQLTAVAAELDTRSVARGPGTG